jgi:putative transposase
VVKAASRRETARYLQAAYHISQHRAGLVIGISNSSLRYRSCRPPDEALRQRLRELAA